MLLRIVVPLATAWLLAAPLAAAELPVAFLKTYCYECHSGAEAESAVDLTALPTDLSNRETFAKWVKIHDRIASGEMPPKDAKLPPDAERTKTVKAMQLDLTAAEQERFAREGRTPVRRLTRVEYENTIRDLLALDGIMLQASLPEDGSAHGFDKNADALDISHVNLARYVETADAALDMAIAVQPQPPLRQTHRFSLARHIYHIIMNGDAVMLKDGKADTVFPPSGKVAHVGSPEHINLFRDSLKRGASPGVFRHEDESFKPYFYDFACLYPGRYRIKTSFWSFGWDKGKVTPGRGVEAARLSVVQLQEDGRGGGHPSYILGYFDAPADKPQEHELHTWLNFKDTLGFNTASLAPVQNYYKPDRALAFTGPGIACDFIEIEGPIHEQWPPEGHRRLFGDLPLVAFETPKNSSDVRPPKRKLVRRETQAPNQPDPPVGNWTVASLWPAADADKLLASFLPRAFRRPVSDEVRGQYLELFKQRLAAGDCFETALRFAYRAALTSPDFLYHVDNPEWFDDFALASRLSYFLWNSLPDDQLIQLAESGQLRQAKTLRDQVERMLKDAKAQRFIDDFLNQWLNLRKIAANDPDKKLYPEFSPYLQDSMIAESRAYFRELLEKDLDASYLVRSDFAMLNEKLATLYGFSGVSGSQIRRVPVPAGCPRGPFLTQAAVLKVTANGTTTSPVPRGAFVMTRFLGRPPEPPPPNVPAVEPDVQGATTIREQLDKHRSNQVCAGCHSKIDPPGFALEAFDVIGGQRDRYRAIRNPEEPAAPRGVIDPFIAINFKLGPTVDPSGTLDGRTFAGINDFQALLAADSRPLAKNLVEQLCVYSTGRPIGFGDRAEINAIVERVTKKKAGVRTLIHEIVASKLFLPEGPMDKTKPTPPPAAKPTFTRAVPVLPAKVAAKTAPAVASVPRLVEPTAVAPFKTDREPVRYRLVGLGHAERREELLDALAQMPEVQLVDLDLNLQELTLAYDMSRLNPQSPDHKPQPDQLRQQLDGILRRVSHGSFSLKPQLEPEQRSRLKQEAIAVVIPDCRACRATVCNTVAKVDGVEQSAFDDKSNRLIVWLDPAKADLQPLRDALTKAKVEFPKTAEEPAKK
jgi:hypothetical protein